MEALEAIFTRRTAPPATMAEPGPDDATLDLLLAAAEAAPDHGHLQPWHTIVVRGDARRGLGELFASSLAAEHPDWPEAELARHRCAPLRAPVIVILAATPDPAHAKIPEIEQLAAAAAAAQNFLLAAHARGFACKWATGKPAYSPGVKRGLGLDPTDRILAIIYVGSPALPHAAPQRPTSARRVRVWTGPGSCDR